MTPAEKQLSDQLHSALGVKPCEHQDQYLGGGITAENVGHSIRIIDPGSGDIVVITPQQFQELTRFAERIGWQCD